MWEPIATAPFGRNLELAVIDRNSGVHALVFPCRRTEEGWLDVLMDRLIEVRPMATGGINSLSACRTVLGSLRARRPAAGQVAFPKDCAVVIRGKLNDIDERETGRLNGRSHVGRLHPHIRPRAARLP